MKFDFTVKDKKGTVVATFPSLPSTGNMDEQQGKITNSTYHSLEFDIPEEGDYTVTYSMTAGWAAVIVGNLKIATAMSTAERYKGTFQRTLKEAKDLYASLSEDILSTEEAQNLKAAIEDYEALVSTSPTVYEQATAALADAIAKASKVAAVGNIFEDNAGEGDCYDVFGRRINKANLYKGQIYIQNAKKHIAH